MEQDPPFSYGIAYFMDVSFLAMSAARILWHSINMFNLLTVFVQEKYD